MAEIEAKTSEIIEGTQVDTEGTKVSAVVTCSDKEGLETNIKEGKKGDEIHPKGQELPELIRRKDNQKGMMPCLPSINLVELTTILRDPNMPSQKILQEVADKIMLKSEESESDDGSVSSGGGVVGMKGLLDCIFEVSYMHEDSDSSDDDESFERFPRQIPCTFCNKIFGSTMTWNTHVLVAHPQQEPSVYNIRRTTVSESEKKDKAHPHRRHLKGSSKSESDARDAKVHHTSSANTKHEESLPVRKRHSSFSKSQHKDVVKSDHKSQPSTCQMRKESLSEKEVHSSILTCDVIKEVPETETTVFLNEAAESAVKYELPLQQLDNVGRIESEFNDSSTSISNFQMHNLEKSSCLNQVKDDAQVLQHSGAANDTHVPLGPSDYADEQSTNSTCGRKRRTMPELSESTSSSSLSPKRSRKTVSKD